MKKSLITMMLVQIFWLMSLSIVFAQRGGGGNGCQTMFPCGSPITMNVSTLTQIPGCVNIADDSWTIAVVVGNTSITPTITQLGHNGGYLNDFVPLEIQFTIPCDLIPVGGCVNFHVTFSVDLWEQNNPCVFNNPVSSPDYCVCNPGIPPPPPPCVDCEYLPKYPCGQVVTMDVSALTKIPDCVNIADDSWSITVEIGNLTFIPTITQLGHNGGWINDFVPLQIQFVIPCGVLPEHCCQLAHVVFSVDLWEVKQQPCVFNNVRVGPDFCICEDGTPPPCQTFCNAPIAYNCGQTVVMDVSALTKIPDCVNIADDSWTISVEIGNQSITPTITKLGHNGGWINDFVPLEISFNLPCDLVQSGCCAPFHINFTVDLWEVKHQPCVFNNPVNSVDYCLCNGITETKPREEDITVLKSGAGNAHTVTVFPNPTSDVINIRTTETPVSYKVVNQKGQFVAEGKDFEQPVDIRKLTNGTYFIIVSFGDGAKSECKFVKTN